MGVMEQVEPGRLIVTPHPITLDGQRNIAAELLPHETLGAFLARTVPEWEADCWEVRINGVVVPYEVMDRVRPKPGTLIEARGAVGRNALYIVAFAALTYFTFGIGAAGGAAAGAFGGGLAGSAFALGTFVAGSVLINKVLGPKIGRAGGDREQQSVHSIAAARNRARPYEPPGLLFGSVRIAPDLLSQPYTWFEADEQYLGMILTPGINVHSVEALYNGDALLSSFEGVQVWHSRFPGMPEQPIPLQSNADSIAGGELENNGAWIERTGSPNTIGLQIDIEGLLYDVDKHGTIHRNSVPLYIQYRQVGASSWTSHPTQTIVNASTRVIRRTYAITVPVGQYEVRVRLGQPTWNEGSGKDECKFAWTVLKSIQPDNATYNGLPGIGIKMKATGQLNGTPDEIRCVAHSMPIPVWKGSEWVTERSSNPGAQILAYARGISAGGERVGGMGLPDRMIDVPSLQAFSLHCAANGYTYDYWLTEARSHDEVLNSIARAGFGQISWAGGKLSVVWAADDQPLSGVVNMATIKKGQFQVDYTLANAADGVEVTYFDAAAAETRTLRIPAPGIETMLNPAQLQLEGVTTEAHAARQGRWHLAQSLYQYKDITYSTDIEHLSYRRMSLLALQHDLTQWGYGGRLRGASIVGGVVSLALDEPVPAPATGNAWIGLRIPGERNYRVFQIQPFDGESDTLTLSGVWPNDAPLPGSSDANPAHDTIWVYDFRQTPGLRCRVVQIQPESGMKGARVVVVPESPEIWHYVNTGEYIPAPPNSLLQTRPVASDLRVTEQQIVQGDTVYTELTATFAVTGPVGETVVLAADEDGILEEVARTTTRTATWRIPRAGVYTIVVRPYSPEGTAGVAASVVYATAGADAPPVLVDLFDVEQRSGGVRLYTWGWLDDTIQSADFAGVEIRYVAGTVASPNWEAMTPIGETGYFTAPFEAVIPAGGTWTFACRSRNTSGRLSTGMRTITRTLQANVGQIIDEITDKQVEEQQRLDQEIADRIAAILAATAAAAADATAKANAARDAAIARVDALAAEVADITGAPEWEADVAYDAGDLVRHAGGLYRALVANTNVEPGAAPSTWGKVGDFANLGEAVAAAITMSTQNATAIQATSSRVDAVVARMPTGNGLLATDAQVSSEAAARAAADVANASRIEQVAASVSAAFAGTQVWEFINANTLNPSYHGFTATNATLASFVAPSSYGATALAASASDPQLTSPVIAIDGKSNPFVRAYIRRRSGNSTWDGRLFWATTGHGISASHVVVTTSPTPPRGGGDDNWHVVEWDLSGNADWTQSTITQIRLDFDGDVESTVDIRLIAIGNKTGGGASSSRVALVETASVTRDNAIAVRTAIMEARMPTGNGALATDARVTDVDTASVSRDAALGSRTTVIEAALNNTTTGLSATYARVVSEEQARIAGDAANATSIQQVAVRVETPFSGTQVWEFVNASPSYHGFTATNATLASFVAPSSYGATALSATALDPQFTSPVVAIDGKRSNVVRAMIRRRSGTAAWDGRLFWSTPGHGFSSTYSAVAAQVPRGDWAIVEWDLTTVADWNQSTITRLRFDFDGDAPSTVDIRWIAVGNRNGSPSSATATQALEATVDQVNGIVRARHTVALDVNGNISGTVNENDGQRSVFSVIADVFRLIASGAVGAEWNRRGSTTYFMRFYASAIQIIMGINFGSQSNLMFWYGPNVGEQNCDKNNGKVCFDNAGDAYFGGRLTAGTLTTAYNSNVALNSEYQFDHGPSSGRPKAVLTNASIIAQGFFAGDQRPSYPTRTWTWRRRIYRNGTLIRTDTVTGTSSAQFIVPPSDEYPGLQQPSTVVTDSAAFPQITFNDDSALTGTITYRVVFDRSAGQVPYATPTGNSNTTIIEQ